MPQKGHQVRTRLIQSTRFTVPVHPVLSARPPGSQCPSTRKAMSGHQWPSVAVHPWKATYGSMSFGWSSEKPCGRCRSPQAEYGIARAYAMTLGTEMPPAKRSASMSMLASCVTFTGPSARISSGEILCSAASYLVSHVAISGNQLQSVAINGNQWQSVAISGNQCSAASYLVSHVAISGNQW